MKSPLYSLPTLYLKIKLWPMANCRLLTICLENLSLRAWKTFQARILDV